MSELETLQVGIVGAAGRGGSFQRAFELLQGVRVRAVCDIRAEELAEAAARFGASESYTDYQEMLAHADLDAVVIGTPMPYHVSQAIAALEQGVHVLSEVPAGVSIDECRELVRACQRSRATYMLAENCNYYEQVVLVAELVRRGLFGTPYYAEGEYLHELKALNESTPWRRKWQTGINGITYGTHNLGPILRWMPGERVVSVCCAGSGHHYRDPRGEWYENEDSCVMLGKLRGGGLIKLRVDMLSNRPYGLNWSLQGTDGCYESARATGERGRIWLRALSDSPDTWFDPETLAEDYLPDDWRERARLAEGMGHGGADFYVIADFIGAIREGREPPIGIHEAMDMTLPGLVSQQSIQEGGRWLDVPDSREW